jgi:hypothetical protein
MGTNESTPNLDTLAEAVRHLIMTDPMPVLDGLHCLNPLCQAQSWGLLSLANWTEGDLIAHLLTGYPGE